MRLARALGAGGLLFVVAGSCTNDFDQFDFEGPPAMAKPSTAGRPAVFDNTGGYGATTSGRGGRAGSGNDGGTGAVSGTGARGGAAGTNATGGGGTGAGGSGATGESGDGGQAPQGGAGAGAMSGAGGAGASGCPRDQQECDGTCFPLAALEHCGSCEKACVAGFACEPSGCVCDASEDCAAPLTGAGGNGGESAGGGAGDAQGGAAAVSAQCVAGRCVCGVTECGENQRCQADGSCG